LGAVLAVGRNGLRHCSVGATADLGTARQRGKITLRDCRRRAQLGTTKRQCAWCRAVRLSDWANQRFHLRRSRRSRDFRRIARRRRGYDGDRPASNKPRRSQSYLATTLSVTALSHGRPNPQRASRGYTVFPNPGFGSQLVGFVRDGNDTSSRSALLNLHLELLRFLLHSYPSKFTDETESFRRRGRTILLDGDPSALSIGVQVFLPRLR
jgi:hypothetical protein